MTQLRTASPGRRLLPLLSAVLVLALLGAPAGAADGIEVPLVAVGGGPLDDLLPVDGDLFEVPFNNTIALTGETPVEAAIALSQATFETAANVLLTRDDLFADAMSSGSAQGVLGAPLLVTDRDSLDARVIEELERLGAETVYLLGGTEALRAVVEETLIGLGYSTERVFGPTRVETAIAVAGRFLPEAGSAVVVRGYPSPALADPTQAYADLLAVGALAAEDQVPVFLTPTDDLTATLHAYLDTSAIGEARVIGGSAAVAESVLQTLGSLGIDTRRVAGANRSATAVAVAEERGFSSSSDAARIILAEGQREHTWAPGFAASAHAAVHDAPIVLSLGTVLPAETLAFLVDANLLDDGPTLICAPFVSPFACAEAAVALGQLPLIGLEPSLEIIGDVLELGEELAGQVVNASVMTVDLCGLSEEEADLASDGSFAVALPLSLPLGVCDVVFTVTGLNGLIYEGQVAITLVEDLLALP